MLSEMGWIAEDHRTMEGRSCFCDEMESFVRDVVKDDDDVCITYYLLCVRQNLNVLTECAKAKNCKNQARHGSLIWGVL
jgi:hypothetical protein